MGSCEVLFPTEDMLAGFCDYYFRLLKQFHFDIKNFILVFSI
jgi:hypothetical protein